jgi:hypothetical protein
MAQNVAINSTGSSPSGNAMLEVEQSNTGGSAKGINVLMPTSSELTSPAISVKGYSPAIELMDKDGVQNWFIGIDDNDNNKLLFGRGYGPGQGVDPVMSITTSDYVGIGTTSPSAPLHVSTNSASGNGSGSYAFFYYNSTALHYGSNFGTFEEISIYSEGNVVSTEAFLSSENFTFSDKRIKTDIKELNNSIYVIKKLKPVQYTKIDKIQNGNKLHYGFIAQEVEDVIPNVINTGIGEVPVLKPFEDVTFEEGVEYTILVKNGDDIKEMKYKTDDARPVGDIIVKSKTINDFKSITYDMIFTVAVDAIQEQQKIIEAQQQQINELKSQNTENINHLRAEIENLKKAVYTNTQLTDNK